MKSKGFTLVELLAVLVILALILTIVIPIVSTTIVKSKRSATSQSLKLYLSAVEKSTLKDNIDGNNYILNGSYSINNNGDICLDTNCNKILEVVAKNKPKSGSVSFIDGQVVGYRNVQIGDFYLNEENGEIKLAQDVEPLCVLLEKHGTTSPIGDKYSCKVDPKREAYIFYVLSNSNTNDQNVNLIMEANIDSLGNPVKEQVLEDNDTVSWISYSDYVLAGGTEEAWKSQNLTIYGPITALKFLDNATKGWTNLNNFNEEYEDEGGNYTKIKLTGKARMPYMNEIPSYDGSNLYLYNYLNDLDGFQVTPVNDLVGYWTLSSKYRADAYVVYDFGSVGVDDDLVNTGGYIGVRPIITVSKSDLSQTTNAS